MMDTFHSFDLSPVFFNYIRYDHKGKKWHLRTNKIPPRGVDSLDATNIQASSMHLSLDRALTKICETDSKVLANLFVVAMDPKGKDVVAYIDWNRQFLQVSLEVGKHLANDDELRGALGPCQVKHVLTGQGGTITVVLVLENGTLVWSENVLIQSAEILEEKGAGLAQFCARLRGGLEATCRSSAYAQGAPLVLFTVWDIGKKLNKKNATSNTSSIKTPTKGAGGEAQIAVAIEALEDALRDHALASHIVAPGTLAALAANLKSVKVLVRTALQRRGEGAGRSNQLPKIVDQGWTSAQDEVLEEDAGGCVRGAQSAAVNAAGANSQTPSPAIIA